MILQSCKKVSLYFTSSREARMQLGKCDECKECICMLVDWFLSVSGRFILILKFTVLSSGFIVRNAMVVHLSLRLANGSLVLHK